MIIRELITKFGFQVDDAKLEKLGKGIAKAKRNLDAAGESALRIGKGLTLGVTLPVVGLGAAFIKAASDAEEAESKFNAVYKSIQGEAGATAKLISKGYGLNNKEAKEFLANTGDLLTGFGFTQETALDLSNQVTQLAVDLASFTNFSGGATGASHALSRALLGEREAIKSLGIAILETDVKARVSLNTQKGIVFETERQAKAYATLQLAQEQSKNAIGDFARTSDQAANQFRILRSRIMNVAITFGKLLLPTAIKLTESLIEMLDFISELSEGSKKLILVFGGLAAVVGPLLILFGSAIGLVGMLATGYMGLANAIGVTNIGLALMAAKIILIALLISAAFIGLYLIIDDLVAFFTGGNSVTGKVLSAIGEWFSGIGTWIAEAWDSAIDGVMDSIKSAFESAVASIGPALSSALASVLSAGDLFSGAWDSAKDSVSNVLGFSPETDPVTENTTNEKRDETINATANITVEIGEANEEQLNQAAEKVKRGVNFGLSDMINAARRDVATPIAE